MTVTPSFFSISTDNIQDSTSWNIHPFLSSFIPGSLLASVNKVGVLHPPIVVRSKDNAFKILNGRKRIRCVELSGAPEVLCAVFPQTTPVKVLLTVLLHDQIAASPLSLPEIAVFVKICMDHFDADKAIKMIPEGFRPKSHSHQLLQLLEFEDDILQKLHFGQLTDKIIPDLRQYSPAEQKEIAHLIDTLHLGGNKQKRLVTLLRDITLRENISFSSLLAETDVQEIVEHPEMNVPQKATRFFEILQKRCFPQSTHAKEEFLSLVRDLLLPENFTISPSPFFERDEVTLAIRFPDFKSCKEAAPLLKGVLNKNQ